jgi:NADH-quinone oxidoreductase subunit J
LIQLAIFYVFAAVLLVAATVVIISRNPVYSALFLVLCFFTSSALWLLAEAEFLGIALVLVYVGAVMVLFLFVVMMLDINLSPMREGFARYLPVGIAVGAIMVAEMALVVGSGSAEFAEGSIASTVVEGGESNNVRLLGNVIYTKYVFPFEVAAVVLLVAIIAAIMLTLRRREGTKHQAIAEQVAVRKSDRLRLVRDPRGKRDNN